MPRQKLTSVSDPFLLLCEGAHDREFFRHLLTRRNIQGITVCSNYGLTNVSGNTAFRDALDSLVAVAGFDQLRAIIIATDSDRNPSESFTAIRDQIARTSDILGPPTRRFPVPAAPQVLAQGSPAIVVLMVPSPDRPGALETLCLGAASTTVPQLAACLADFVHCSGADQWLNSIKRDKMRFRAFIAAGNQADPEISPARFWSDGTGHPLIPLDQPEFDSIANFLRDLPALLVPSTALPPPA